MPLVCESFILGWILQRFTKYKKTGHFFTLLAFLLFILFGYGLGRSYLYQIERTYPPFECTQDASQSLDRCLIVVLGQGMPLTSELPLRFQNNAVFERRLFEGIRIAKDIPGSQLLISMAGPAPVEKKCAFLQWYSDLVQFDPKKLSFFIGAQDTSDEARIVKGIVVAANNGILKDIPLQVYDGSLLLRTAEMSETVLDQQKRPIILVTSASHMPRAIKIFKQKGLDPIPAPCDFACDEKPNITWSWTCLPFPAASNYDLSHRACYEYFGRLYEWLKEGFISVQP